MYKDTFNADEQITAEEEIAAIIFHGTDQEIAEEDCKDLGHVILDSIVRRFRPDLIEE